MTENGTTLHLLAGKIASGKSTLARKLAQNPATVLVSEDEWLSTLFGEDMRSVRDYVQYSARLRAAMEPHLVSLLEAGVSVVLDYPANTRHFRAWMKGIADKVACHHQLHFLDFPNEVCKARLRERNEAGDHAFAATDEQFDLITRHFEPPTEEEGFRIVRYSIDGELPRP